MEEQDLTENKESSLFDKISEGTKSVAEKIKNTFKTPKAVKPSPTEVGGGDQAQAVERLKDIFKIMQEDRKDVLKHRLDLKNKKREFARDEEQQHDEIIAALGGKPGVTSTTPKKKEKPESEKPKKSGMSESKAQVLGGALAAGGMALSAAMRSKPPKPKEAPQIKPETATKATGTTGAPGPSAGKSEATPSAGAGGDPSVMEMIKRHEGVRLQPYKDTKGLWTVGVGHLIGDGKTLPANMNRTFTQQEVDAMFAQDYEHHRKAAEKIPGFDKLNEKGQGALIDLTFNMGPTWYKKWPNLTKSLEQGDTKAAAQNLQESAWYKQVGRRGPEIVAMIRDSGKGTASKDTTPPPPAAAESSAKAVTESTKPGAGGSTKPPTKISPVVTTQSGVDLNGINPELEKRVAAMAAAFQEKTGKKLLITSGFRSNEKQKQLWDAKLKQFGGDVAATRKLVAEPAAPLGNGRGSMHMVGMALDIDSKGASSINLLAGPRNKSTGWLESFGLSRPVPNEDWHVQLAGAPATPDNPVQPGAPVMVASKEGAVDLSSNKKESIPPAASQAKPSASAVPSAPKSASVPQQSAANKDLKDTMAGEQPKVVLNNKSTEKTTTGTNTKTTAKVDDDPVYLRKIIYG